jgi:hypothetical protein
MKIFEVRLFLCFLILKFLLGLSYGTLDLSGPKWYETEISKYRISEISQYPPIKSCAYGMAQVVRHMPSKQEALSLNPQPHTHTHTHTLN